jgi:hypothetical protein
MEQILQTDQAPSSNVTHKVPRSPAKTPTIVAAVVSRIDPHEHLAHGVHHRHRNRFSMNP